MVAVAGAVDPRDRVEQLASIGRLRIAEHLARGALLDKRAVLHHAHPIGHPRDLLSQISNYCKYNGLPLELLPEYCDIVVQSYFAMVLKTPHH